MRLQAHSQLLYLRACLQAQGQACTRQVKHCPWPQGDQATVGHGLAQEASEDMTTDKVSLQIVVATLTLFTVAFHPWSRVMGVSH